MSNKSTINGQSQGDQPIPSLDEIERLLTQDIGFAIGFLTALNEDKDLRRMIAVWFEGRMINLRNSKKLGNVMGGKSPVAGS